MFFYPFGIDPTSGSGGGGGEPASDEELLTLQREQETPDGMGSFIRDWVDVEPDLVGKVRFYKDKSTRQRLENNPGVQTKTDKIVFFEGDLVTLDVKVNDRIVRGDGEKLLVQHVRRYESSLQLDTEIVK